MALDVEPWSALQIAESQAGATVAVRAMPRAGRSAIAGVRDGRLLIRLQSAPADGAANAELVDVLARALQVPKRDLEIVSGGTARVKRVRVAGLSAATVLERLSLRHP
jgi:uncharacterized protein